MGDTHDINVCAVPSQQIRNGRNETTTPTTTTK
jgi:hypothetical protein